MVNGSYNAERERLPEVNKINNSAMGGAVLWCPHDGTRLQYERININNYMCPHCFYEHPKPQRQESDPENATISTIDGWVDTGYFDMGTKTAKFRPVQGPRKDSITKVRQHPLMQTIDPEMRYFVEKAHGSMTITSSEVVANRTDGIIDASGENGRSGYKARARKKGLY